MLHLVLVIVLARYKVLIGAVLQTCLLTTTLCLVILRFYIVPILAQCEAIQNDTCLTTKSGAATDIHVVASDWNASQMDVLVGYSSQLHALTNIPARANRPKTLTVISCILGATLLMQAALLTKLVNGKPPEAWGSVICLAVYLAMAAIHSLWVKATSRYQLSSESVNVKSAHQVLLSGRPADDESKSR